jgi:hypothetical protein
MSRGILRVQDLHARSVRVEGSKCWIWRGAYASDKVSPRIWTLDYDRGEKRTLSGPRAVLSISSGAPIGDKLAFMACCNSKCVNPEHVRVAASKAEIGAHYSAAGKRKGTHYEQRLAAVRKAQAARGLVPTPESVVRVIRAAGAEVSTRALARAHGIAEQTACRIRLGQSHRGVAQGAA